MSTLDGSILNIANPTIADYFNVSIDSVQWIVTIYMLVITATLMFWGKLGDQIGSERLYSLGFLLFAVGSLACSLSFTLVLLIIARAFQALGASMMMATGIGIVFNSFPPGERGKALGFTGSMVGIGNMTGPGLGGLLVAAWGWKSIFLINVPIGLIGFLLASKYLPLQPSSKKTPEFDIPGTITFALFAFTLVISLASGIKPVLLSISILLFALFIWLENKSQKPMLDFALFKEKNFTYGNIMAFFAYSTQTFVTFLLPFYFENILQYSPTVSGLMMTIPPLSMAISAPLAGNLSDKIGPTRLTTASFILMIMAFLSLSSLDQHVNLPLIITGLLLLGIGNGCFGSPNNSSIMASIPPNKTGYTGGFISTIRNFSFSLGIAVSVATFTGILNYNSPRLGYIAAYITAHHLVFCLAAALAACGLVFSLLSTQYRKPTAAKAEQDNT